jgi:Ser/Thr protein kinase RdoA (MazF antagonist)
VAVRQIYYNIGAALAHLHTALATFPEPIASWTMNLAHTVFTEAVPQIKNALTGAEAAAFHEVVDAIRPEMSDALAGLPVQTIHGDCHGGNFLLYRGDVSGFIDLDHLPQGPRAYDIGYLLADMAKARFVGSHAHDTWLENFDQVLAGYERESKLSQRERHALWYIMLATQLLMAHWLFKHGSSEIAFKNLEGFYWIVQRRDEIAGRISA